MKKILIILTAACLLGGAYFFSAKSNTTQPDVTYNKTLEMTVFSAANYSSDVYNGSVVGLNVTVTKVTGNKKLIVWQKDFPSLELKKFPSLDNAFKPSIDLPGSSASDVFEITYKLTYNSNGSILEMEQSKTITGSDINSDLYINI
ncbi:hypothetical protein BH11BAC6_BH11BAC6_08850 [soil metagenome]